MLQSRANSEKRTNAISCTESSAHIGHCVRPGGRKSRPDMLPSRDNHFNVLSNVHYLCPCECWREFLGQTIRAHYPSKHQSERTGLRRRTAVDCVLSRYYCCNQRLRVHRRVDYETCAIHIINVQIKSVSSLSNRRAYRIVFWWMDSRPPTQKQHGSGFDVEEDTHVISFFFFEHSVFNYNLTISNHQIHFGLTKINDRVQNRMRGRFSCTTSNHRFSYLNAWRVSDSAASCGTYSSDACIRLSVTVATVATSPIKSTHRANEICKFTCPYIYSICFDG